MGSLIVAATEISKLTTADPDEFDIPRLRARLAAAEQKLDQINAVTGEPDAGERVRAIIDAGASAHDDRLADFVDELAADWFDTYMVAALTEHLAPWTDVENENARYLYMEQSRFAVEVYDFFQHRMGYLAQSLRPAEGQPAELSAA